MKQTIHDFTRFMPEIHMYGPDDEGPGHYAPWTAIDRYILQRTVALCIRYDRRDAAFMNAISDNWAKVPPKAEQRRVAL